METKLFHPRDLNEAKHAAVGNCNNVSMEKRYAEETPVFANAILRHLGNPRDKTIVDYGIGPGRIAKELLRISDEKKYNLKIIGVDNSPEMLDIAAKNVNHSKFYPTLPEDLTKEADFTYLVYCLQHIPSIAIRESLQRIYTFLKKEGKLFYCSSDYRMAIRFDNPGFFDDRFLGVNLQEEISRYFNKIGEAFTQEELDAHPTVKAMVKSDGLVHPALIYGKKEIKGHLFNAKTDANIIVKEKTEVKKEEVKKEEDISKYKKLILQNRLSPGDILVMTCAIRALHKAYPGEYKTDVRSPASQIFEHNTYITHLDENAPDVKTIDMLYPEIHKSGESGKHFSDGHRLYLASVIKKPIPQNSMRPDIFLTQDEKIWLNPFALEYGNKDKYWIINAGSKQDYTLKQYPYFQEVVDLLKDKIIFVQIGQKGHIHDKLNYAFDMRGKTDLRQLFRLIYHAEGVITCVSLPMHIAAAFAKPCVVIAGGREGPRWEFYPNQRYLHTTGCLNCCKWDGCWRSKLESCLNLIEDDKYGKVSKCQKLITPKMIKEAIIMYYEGGVLIEEKKKVCDEV